MNLTKKLKLLIQTPFQRRTHMKKKKTLKLLTPVTKTVFLGYHASQKASYLQLPKNYREDLLEEDIKNGASIYKPCAAESGNFSNYTIISAPTQEDGYRAVLYLASQAAAANCEEEDKDDEIEDYTPTKDPSDEYIHYEEDFSRIPLIPSCDLTDYDAPSSDNTFGMALQMEMQKNNMRRTPWWMDCSINAVCIVEHSADDPFFRLAAVCDSTIENLKRFEHNEHVYVLIIGSDISTDDFSISKTMLEYTAPYYNLQCEESELKAYHHKLFEDLTLQYKLSFSKNTDTRLLSEKLASIDPDRPCATYEKTLKYILHTNAKLPVTPDIFKKMGLSQMVNLAEEHPEIKQMQNSLFGMESVKKELDGIMNVLRYNKIREEHKLKPLNYHKTFLFIGAPGTAKTTMAQILADQMATEGFLRGNRFVSVNGAQLKAPFLGQTASLVHSLFEENDAILIDEAYSLTSSQGGEMDSYGQEALAQLMIELEKHAKDKLIIFAGYGGKKVSREHNKMIQFIEANPGLKSRINTTIYFDSYEPDVMVQITHHLASASGLTVSTDCDPLIRNYFAQRMRKNDFGNGREARSLLEQCQVALAGRLLKENAKEELDYSLITKDDVADTIRALSEMNCQQQGVSAKFGYL